MPPMRAARRRQRWRKEGIEVAHRRPARRRRTTLRQRRVAAIDPFATPSAFIDLHAHGIARIVRLGASRAREDRTHDQTQRKGAPAQDTHAGPPKLGLRRPKPIPETLIPSALYRQDLTVAMTPLQQVGLLSAPKSYRQHIALR